MEEKYRQLRTIVEKEMDGASPAHDINHVMRVYNLCLELASYELDVDMDALKTAALLHDIARTKEDRDGHTHLLSVDHAALGAEMSGKILKELGYPEEKIDHIKHCIAAHRFRGGNPPRTIEAKIRARAAFTKSTPTFEFLKVISRSEKLRGKPVRTSFFTKDPTYRISRRAMLC
jgi:uncharacterized protein